jgi:hypothetical protein
MFMSPPSRTEASLKNLREISFPLRCQGNFDLLYAELSQRPEILAALQDARYSPVNDAVLLEMRAISSATFDAIGKFDEARSFVSRWASEIHFLVIEVLGRPEPERKTTLSKDRELWSRRSWFLQRCGVAEYRASHYDTAHGYLSPALLLSEKMLELTEFSPAPLLEAAALEGTNFYWLGCIELYANKFSTAEKHFVDGLEVLTKTLDGLILPLDDDLPNHKVADDVERKQRLALKLAMYVIARLLLGLGLLNFHRGRLTDAKCNLLASSAVLRRDSSDKRRKLRAQLLLLSVERINAGTVEELEHIAVKVEALAVKFEDIKHFRYFSRTQLTLSLIKCDLAKAYEREGKKEDRDRSLNEALSIVEKYGRVAADSLVDELQMDVLKIRILRKMDRTADAITWGTIVVDRTKQLDQGFLHAESLLALAHVYYREFEKTADKNYLEQARDRVTEAQATAVNEGNYRTMALCTLHLARIASKSGDFLRAVRLIGQWKYLEELVEHDWIKEFGEKVQNEIETGDCAILPVDSTEKVYISMNRKLREYLLKDFARGENDTDAAEKIGISRQTLHAWKKELGLQNRKSDAE